MNHMGQLCFDDLLTSADAENTARAFERETAHLPGTMADGIACYRAMLERHHAAMLDADADAAMELRKEARLLARKLSGGDPGYLASDDAPGCVLERETAAAPGTVPVWGQAGAFGITAGGMRVRIEMEGMFGIAAGVCFWLGFAAHAVDLERPFLSETGYRSFLGVHAEPQSDLTPETFATRIIDAYIADELGGKLLTIAPRYRDRRRGVS